MGPYSWDMRAMRRAGFRFIFARSNFRFREHPEKEYPPDFRWVLHIVSC